MRMGQDIVVSPTAVTRGEWHRWRHHKGAGQNDADKYNNGGEGAGDAWSGAGAGGGFGEKSGGGDDVKGRHGAKGKKASFNVAMVRPRGFTHTVVGASFQFHLSAPLMCVARPSP